jgi:hypothetical protein
MQDRYEHSIIDVCVDLHDDISGSGDPLSLERREQLIDWLRRRLKAWKNTPNDFHVSTCDYDHAVRLLAKATLEMHDANRREFGL